VRQIIAMNAGKFLSALTRSFSDLTFGGRGPPGRGPGASLGTRPPLLYCRGIDQS
jgi:hypothetical protein